MELLVVELLQPVFHGERPVGGLAGLAIGGGHEDAGESADGADHEQPHGALIGSRRHGATDARLRQWDASEKRDLEESKVEGLEERQREPYTNATLHATTTLLIVIIDYRNPNVTRL